MSAALLAPTGELRAAINLANFLLVSDRAPDGTPLGVAPSLAADLAARLGVPVRFLPYATPGELCDSAASGDWDVGFVGADPARAGALAFTDPYCGIEATFLVRDDAPFRACADLDAPGVSVAVSARTAYDLWLDANFRRADLRRAADIDASHALFFDAGLDALAGLRPKLRAEAAARPGLRVLPDRFALVEQAACLPRARAEGLDALRAFIDAAKASGRVAELIAAFGVDRDLLPAP